MTTALRTDRLDLRPPRPEDADELFAAIADFDIVRYLSTPPWPYTRAAADGYVARVTAAAAEGRGIYFTVRRLSDGRLVGNADLRFDPERTAHFGYWIAKEFWGQGYATEALGAILEHGFGALGLDRIWGAAMPENPASVRVMEKHGLEDAGMMTVKRPNFGDAVEMAVRDIRRADWLDRRS